MLDTQQENDRESLGYLLGISTLYFLRASVQYKFVKQKKTEVSAASNFCPQFSVSHRQQTGNNINNSNHELPAATAAATSLLLLNPYILKQSRHRVSPEKFRCTAATPVQIIVCCTNEGQI